MATRVDGSSGEGLAASTKPAALGTKPRLAPKPFSTQRNVIRSIHAPKTVTPVSPASKNVGPIAESPTGPKPNLNTFSKPIDTGNPTAKTPDKSESHVIGKYVDTKVVKPMSETPIQHSSQPNTISDSKLISVDAHTQGQTKAMKEEKNNLEKQHSSDPKSVPNNSNNNSSSASQNAESKSDHPDFLKPTVTAKPVNTQITKPSILITAEQKGEEKGNETQKSDFSPLSPKPQVSLRKTNSIASPSANETSRRGTSRNRLSMELTSKFESSGLSLTSPLGTVPTINTRDGENKTTPSERRHTTPAQPNRIGEGELTEGGKEDRSGGSSIKRRISLLLDSRPEVIMKREEPQVLLSPTKGTGGVRERIKSWTADTSESPRAENKPPSLPRGRNKSSESEKTLLEDVPESDLLSTVDTTPKNVPSEVPQREPLSIQAVDPPPEVSSAEQPAQRSLERPEDAAANEQLECSAVPAESPQSSESTDLLTDSSPGIVQPAADVNVIGDSSAVNDSVQPASPKVRRRSVRFGVVERFDGGPPVVLGSESESSAEEEELSEDEPEVEEPVSVPLPVYNRVGLQRNNDTEKLSVEEETKREQGDEVQKIQLQAALQKDRDDETERQKEKRLKEEEKKREEKEREILEENLRKAFNERERQREEERLQEEEKERDRLKEKEKERERLREEERERERQLEIRWQKQREEEIEMARQKEERLKEEERQREEEREREREKERLREERLREEEREKERLREERERERLREEETERERLREEENEKERRREERERERLREEKEKERLREEEMVRERLREEEKVRLRVEREEQENEKERQRLCKKEEMERERLRQIESERLMEEEKVKEQERERQTQDEIERRKAKELEESLREAVRRSEEEESKLLDEETNEGERREEVKEMLTIESEDRQTEETEEEQKEEKREAESLREGADQDREREDKKLADSKEREDKAETATCDAQIMNLISFDSEDVLPKSESLSRNEGTESQIHTYSDFSVGMPLTEITYEDFSVKPRRWGSKPRSDTSSTQKEVVYPEVEAVDVLVTLDVNPQNDEAPESEQVETSDSPKPSPDPERPGEAEQSPGEIETEEEVSKKCEGEDYKQEEQIKDYSTGGGGSDTDALINNEPGEQQYGSCEEQASPAMDSPKPECDQEPEMPPDEPDTGILDTETELPALPESTTPLLDNQVQRSRAQLGKRRSQRTRLPTSVRNAPAAALPTHTESTTPTTTPDWRTCDSTDGEAVSSKRQASECEEEQPRPKETVPPPATSQRVSMFPGMNPSALMAQLKKRTGGGVEESSEKGVEEESPGEELLAPSASQLSRSPRSPALLAGAARVLPPIGGTDRGTNSAPSWLKELKSKKRLSQCDSET